jgi:hypothetical protein
LYLKGLPLEDMPCISPAAMNAGVEEIRTVALEELKELKAKAVEFRAPRLVLATGPHNAPQSAMLEAKPRRF